MLATSTLAILAALVPQPSLLPRQKNLPRASTVRCVVGRAAGELAHYDHPDTHAKLTIVRHGQSEWNLANRFTGWVDVDLTERGITEARAAGRLLATDGQTHDLVCTSSLRRAIRTACLVLSGTNQCWVSMHKDSRLNEQHSGMLTGNNKAELTEEHGLEQVMSWRRGFDCAPPAQGKDAPLQRMLRADERYRDTLADVPASESLKDTERRVKACWDDTLAPALRAGKNVLVVSHGNTLRALVKLVDGVSSEDSFHLDLPTACPVVYELNKDLKPAADPYGFWGESSAPRHGRFLMSLKKVQQAQDAMRQQCVKDIAVSMVTADGDNDAIATCDAYTAPSSSNKLIELSNGQSFNVRERPPSYFALESERIKIEAQQEIDSMMAQFNNEVQAAPADGEEPADFATAAAAVPSCMLIIVRHGYSEYNAENRFTGWADVELSNRGREEARFAGSLLREAGVRRLERVYTSYLKRAIKTAWLMLDELELQWVPIEYNWRLNERHYGALQGVPKKQASIDFGMRQIQQWRRGINHPPPEWGEAERARTVDRRYDGIDVPGSESLADCMARMRPFLDDELYPAMREAVRAAAEEEAAARSEYESKRPAGISMVAQGVSGRGVPAFVIASSENLIRALVTELDGVDEADVPLLDIPYATPLVYQFDAQMRPQKSSLAVAPLKHGYYLGDKERIEQVQKDIREAIVCEGAMDRKGCDGEEEEECQVRPREEDPENCIVLTEDGQGVEWNCG